MKIYTYFDSSLLLQGQGILLRQWAKSWTDHGWEPRILHPRTAVRHRLLPKFKEMVLGEPPIQKARIMRWLALDAVGGGWLCEYDVLNVGFTPRHARRTERPNGFWSDMRLSLFYASKAAVRKHIVDRVGFSPFWGMVADIGDDDALRLKSSGLLRFSSLGVQKRYGDGVTKSQAIERFLRAA